VSVSIGRAPLPADSRERVERAAARAALRLEEYLALSRPSPALLRKAHADLVEAIELLDARGQPR
jgi:hypothetical protein